MKVIGVETIRVTSFPALLFLQIHTDAGIVGLGETCLGAQAVEAQIHEGVAPRLIGADPMRVSAIGRAQYEDFVGFADAGVATRARSAVDIALMDILGQQSGLPLYQLLGGRFRDSIRIYNSSAGPGYGATDANVDRAGNVPRGASGGRYEDLEIATFRPADLAQDLLDEGITAMKMWHLDAAALRGGGWSVTPADLEAAVAPLAAIRDAVGTRMDILVDMHGTWHLPAAVQVMNALEEYQPYWIEDPVKADDMDAIRYVSDRRRTGVPIAMGETLATAPAFDRLLASHAVDVVMFDVGWVGGVSEAARVAALADTRSRPISPHDTTGPVVLTAGVHISVSSPNALIQETVRAFYRGWYCDLVTDLPEISGGVARPPEGPGLGTRLQPDVPHRPDAVRRISGRAITP